MSHKLAGELPLSDSLTEHTLLPARILSSCSLPPPNPETFTSPPSVLAPFLPLPKIKVYKMASVWVSRVGRGRCSLPSSLTEGAKSRNVGGNRRGTIAWEGVGRGQTRGERERSWSRRGTRKVETTCRNNVRVFDLKHVTEPH